MGQLNEYLGFFDKVDKRIRNEEVTELLPQSSSWSQRADFEGDEQESPAKLTQLQKELEEMAKSYQFKACRAGATTKSTRPGRSASPMRRARSACIDWELASTPEYRQMMSKYAQIEAVHGAAVPDRVRRESKRRRAQPKKRKSSRRRDAPTPRRPKQKTPRLRARRTRKPREPVEKQTPRELFEYVVEQGKKDYQVQRYKGLGEMTAPQLWETTMDPERRTLLSVKLEDIAETETIFTTLMGEDVEARRKFIEENALDVKNLDI